MGRLFYFPPVAASTNALRVVIADDHQLFREGLKGMLQDAGMEVVGEAADGADAAALVTEARSPRWRCSTSTCRAPRACRRCGGSRAATQTSRRWC